MLNWYALISPDKRLGDKDAQLAVVSADIGIPVPKLRHGIARDVVAASREGSIVVVVHAVALGAYRNGYAKREAIMNALAKNGAKIKVVGSDPMPCGTASEQLKIHMLAEDPPRKEEKKPKNPVGRPSIYGTPEGKKRDQLLEAWAGDYTFVQMQKFYASVMDCPEPSYPLLVSKFGNRPPNKDRPQSKRKPKNG